MERCGGRREHREWKNRYSKKRGWLGSRLHHVVSLAHHPLPLVISLPPVFTPFQHKGKRKYGTNRENIHALREELVIVNPVYNNKCHLAYFPSPGLPKRALQRIPHYCTAHHLSPPGQVIWHVIENDASLKINCGGPCCTILGTRFKFFGIAVSFNCALRRGQGARQRQRHKPPTGQGQSELRTQSHEKGTATWKVMPFGNGRVKMKGLFKSVLCLLIPAVMYGLGSEMRCSLQQFPGNYRALNFQTSQLRSSEQMLLSLDTIHTVGVSTLVTTLCGRMAELGKLYLVCWSVIWEQRGKGIIRVSLSALYVYLCAKCMHVIYVYAHMHMSWYELVSQRVSLWNS